MILINKYLNKYFIALVITISFISCSSENFEVQESSLDKARSELGKKVTICHKGKETLTVSPNAIQAHLDHGDIVGDCNDVLICHWEPFEDSWTPLLVPLEEVQFHIDHGDQIGECDGLEYTYIPDPNFELHLIEKGIDSDGIINKRIATIDIADLISLDVSSSREALESTKILDLTGIEDFRSLRTLRCNFNLLKSLNVSKNTNLVNIFCKYNYLTELNVSKNKKLAQLDFSNNFITDINLMENKDLRFLFADNNSLTILNLVNNISLERLGCRNNKLRELNVKNKNNFLINKFLSKGNDDLTCIQVDNADYSSKNWANIDSQHFFSENCGY